MIDEAEPGVILEPGVPGRPYLIAEMQARLEVGVAVADDRLVVNEIVVRESLQDVKQSYLIGA